ncbi:putative oligopeptide transporter, OPT family [Gottschalkia purinilytica]|uniref:Putative oligopeptide transporter, OPT family n=1 Tax=Gottschalkia purinilytica TaxID=1503 RepID=A0A0L0W8S8_GOTPU|nr:oligopeptide transporter, OPT family [Gottschalkia purinilytica]KNF07857.1 putative oligopeptide transporter, OPT family [Gottschalkia purinilytica]
MSEKKGLSHEAYGGIEGKDYKPYISNNHNVPELTMSSLIIGVIFAIVFGAANTYLGLKVGLTISASIPGAILATGILKGVLRRNNTIEANMIQSIGAMGESVAGALIFTIPAIVLWGMDLDLKTIAIIALLGGLLGILFIVPVRKFLTVEEHGKLIYPEGMATSEILVTGSTGGQGFKTVIEGALVGFVYKFLSGGLRFWKESPEWAIKPLQGAVIGVDALASLVGVGYIVGVDIAKYMLAGSIAAWFGLIPLIKYIGSGLTAPLFLSTKLISQMSAAEVWSEYVRYIGAGAVATGGFISLIKSIPTIISSFKAAIVGVQSSDENVSKTTDEDIPLKWIIIGALTVFLVSWILPILDVGIIGGIMVVFFSFFFSVVSARMVGIIGVSNNPVSGMTIATLLFVSAVLRLLGHIGNAGMMKAIIIGAMVCVAISVAGGAAQNMKTTFIIGGTPKHVQIGMYAGIIATSLSVGAIIILLNNTYGIGSQELAAPQATLMSMVVKGVMTGNLPWILVIIGVAFGIMCELIGIPVLPFALGLYLRIHLTLAIFIGGIVRLLIDKKFRNDEETLKRQTERGILLSSGLVAGDALTGIIIAVFAALGINIGIGSSLIPRIANSPVTSIILFGILLIWLYRFTSKTRTS